MAIDMLSYAIGAKNGGGGGGGDCNLFPVTITVDYDHPIADDKYPLTADKTFAEIAEAIDAGKMLLIKEDFGSGIEMNVPTGVSHEQGSEEIAFNYTRFSVHDSSTWNATLWEFLLTEDEGNYLLQTEVSVSVT